MLSVSRSLLLPFLLLAAAPIQAQDQPLPASPAAHPFGLTDNMELVYRRLDDDGDPVGELRQRVVSLKKEEREESKHRVVPETVALVKSGFYTKKKVLGRIQDLSFRARRDTSFTDGMAEVNHEALKPFRDRTISYEAVPLAWPDQPSVGSTLPDGGVNISIRSSVVSIATISMLLQNRRITAGPVPVKTPAGTFTCYKVEAERLEATVPRPDMAMRSSTKQIDFYAPGVGIVRTEYYTKGGKLDEVRELTARNAGTPQHLKSKEKYKAKKS